MNSLIRFIRFMHQPGGDLLYAIKADAFALFFCQQVVGFIDEKYRTLSHWPDVNCAFQVKSIGIFAERIIKASFIWAYEVFPAGSIPMLGYLLKGFSFYGCPHS